MNKVSIILVLLISMMISGCSKSVSVGSVKPAQIDEMSSKKKIAILRFSNDRNNLSNKIESKISYSKINGKRYFTVIDRKNINSIMKEQKFQNNGLFEDSEIVEVGKLLGVQAIITGDVSNQNISRNSYYVEKKKCETRNKNRICRRINVRCVKTVGDLNSVIKITDVSTGDIIHSELVSSSRSYKSCSDSSYVTPSNGSIFEELSSNIAGKFVYKLIPHKYYMKVYIIDELDGEYTDQQEEDFENILKYIDKRRFSKAERLTVDLINSMNNKSYVALYTLAVLKEINGNLIEAQEIYLEADYKTKKPVDEIDNAIIRIKRMIKDKNKSNEQIGR